MNKVKQDFNLTILEFINNKFINRILLSFMLTFEYSMR